MQPLAATDWKALVAPFRRAQTRRSVAQVLNTVLPYLGAWLVMIWALDVSYWITFALTIPAAGLVVRSFIILHDCSHGSFFRSRRANDVCGAILGVITFVPYRQWRREHATHHATSGDLDRRGVGDIWTLTVREYAEASWQTRLAYRLARSPLVLFVLGPIYLFVVKQRFSTSLRGTRDRASVYGTNVAIALIVLLASLTIGWKSYLLIQLPILLFAGAAGIWLFYVQHQFEGVYWERSEEWDFVDAAVHGSSFYKLPRVLQWFSGNIGYHHLHHLSPAIPNYNLEDCHNASPVFGRVKEITLRTSLRSLSFRLWDEERRRLVGYSRPRSAGP